MQKISLNMVFFCGIVSITATYIIPISANREVIGMYKVLITGLTAEYDFHDKEMEIMGDQVQAIRKLELSRAELLDLVSDVDAIMTDTEKIDKEVFDAAPNLKIVVEYGVGIDNIDLNEATRRGIYVCNVPEVYSLDVAEHAAALILACTRELFPSEKDVAQNGVWDNTQFSPLRLTGKTLGLIGCGRIGRNLLNLLRGFSMNYLVHDPYLPLEVIEQAGASSVDLDTLLSTSDVISIHVPKLPSTTHLLNRETLNKMKPGAVLVNVSRGGIIDEEALAEALDSGHIFAAGLDVMEGEPNIENALLRNHPRAFITPHLAWKSENAVLNVQIGAAENIRSFFMDKKPINVCNRSLLT